MDIQRVNTVLNRAIIILQEGEIEAIVEKAVVGGYAVPSPGQMGFGYKPKSPSALGIKSRGLPGNIDWDRWDGGDEKHFNKMVMRRIRKSIKRDIKLVRKIQSYGGGAHMDLYLKGETSPEIPTFTFSMEQKKARIYGNFNDLGVLSDWIILKRNTVVEDIYKWLVSTIRKYLKEKKVSKKKSPKVMTRDEYLGLHGVSGAYTEPGLHSRGLRQVRGKRGSRSIEKAELVRSREYSSEKERRSKEYDEKLRSGEIRAPSYFEKLFQKAAGHPDNPSVQAAKRLIAKHIKKGNIRKKPDGSYEVAKRKR